MIIIESLPRVLLQYITNFLEYRDQIKFINLSKKIKSRVNLTDLNVSQKFSDKIPHEYVHKHMFLIKLSLYDNRYVSDLNDHYFIQYLNISGSCKITQKDIANLKNITELNISNNIDITNLDIFPKLEKLTANGICAINVDSINKLPNLKYLSIKHSPIMYDIDKLKKNIEIVK